MDLVRHESCSKNHTIMWLFTLNHQIWTKRLPQRFSPWTWLISELEERISSASFWAVGSTSVWWAVIRYWTSFCSWSLFIWNNVSEMGNRSFTCTRHTHRNADVCTSCQLRPFYYCKLVYDFFGCLEAASHNWKVLYYVPPALETTVKSKLIYPLSHMLFLLGFYSLYRLYNLQTYSSHYMSKLINVIFRTHHHYICKWYDTYSTTLFTKEKLIIHNLKWFRPFACPCPNGFKPQYIQISINKWTEENLFLLFFLFLITFVMCMFCSLAL